MKTKNKLKLKAGQVWRDEIGDLSYIMEVKKNVREEDMIMGDVSIVVLTGSKAGKCYLDETSASFGEGKYFCEQVA